MGLRICLFGQALGVIQKQKLKQRMEIGSCRGAPQIPLIPLERMRLKKIQQMKI